MTKNSPFYTFFLTFLNLRVLNFSVFSSLASERKLKKVKNEVMIVTTRKLKKVKKEMMIVTTSIYKHDPL